MQGQANRREPGQMPLSPKSVDVNVRFRRARRCLQLAQFGRAPARMILTHLFRWERLLPAWIRWGASNVGFLEGC